MSASESAPGTASLQASIEQLIAETVRRSQTDQEAELERLKAAMRSATSEIESARAAMQRALDALKHGLGDDVSAIEVAETAAIEVAPDSTEALAVPVSDTPVDEMAETVTGPHRIDVIAHNVTIGIASGLQSFLRERPEVSTAQTREFVNGELRLDVEMESGLDVPSLTEWIGTHQGNIVTQTSSVLELRFGKE